MADDERAQFLRSSPEERTRRIAGNFIRIAAAVSEPATEAALTMLLSQTRVWCEWAAVDRSGGEQALLQNLRTALETWARVWPRLGGQPEFRQAVAREAQGWAKRLPAAAQAPRIP